MSKRDYDSTVVRVAGNLLSGCPEHWYSTARRPAVARRMAVVQAAVETARAIIAETKRTEPPHESTEPTAYRAGSVDPEKPT